MWRLCETVLWLVLLLASVSGGPIVDTAYGRLQGITQLDRLDRTYDAFLGVPFAAPPIGELRWQPAEPPADWEGVRSAEKYGAHCIHQIAPLYQFIGYSPDESEDCLYLNVFVPGGVNVTRAAPLPVMIFYYGGANVLGTAEMYPTQELATTGQVISININYRLGIFGWFTTADSAAPGNYGLWDTKAAIEWVRATISDFGGDPDRITVFGQSTGGSLAKHNIISLQTNTLIHGAISMTGSGNIDVPTKSRAQAVADMMMCNTTDSQEIVDCLRLVDGKELDKACNRNGLNYNDVVIDGVFITQDQYSSWQQGYGKDTHYMVGFCHMDFAGVIVKSLLGIPMNFTTELTTEEVHQYLLDMHSNDYDPQHIVMTLYERYPDLADNDTSVCTEALTRFETDRLYGATHYRQITYRLESAGKGSTYHYVFQHRFSFLIGYPDWVNGSHVDDVYAILGDPYFKGLREISRDDLDFNEADRLVSDNVMKYYANFAYSGNPNEGPHEMPTPWPAYDLTNRGFLLETPWPVQRAIQGELQADYEWLLNDYENLKAGTYSNSGGRPQLGWTALSLAWLLKVAVGIWRNI